MQFMAVHKSNDVTNTIWWQDFPRRNSPDCAPLFNQVCHGNANDSLNSDFVAQLARFMATLVADVLSQAYWIIELSIIDMTAVCFIDMTESFRIVSYSKHD